MKAGKAHVVPLSDQALDTVTAFRTMFGTSRYLHPGRHDGDTPISNATLNRVIDTAVGRIGEDDPDFQSFGVHDLRRTLSTGLNRAKFDDRWIEMSLTHVPEQDRGRLQREPLPRRAEDHASVLGDMLDAWLKGESAKS